MLGLSSSSKLDWNSYNVTIANSASKKTEASIRSMKFLSSEFAFYLYRCTINPCPEYCCHVRTGASRWYLDMLDKLQKLVFRAVGPAVAASLRPLAYHQNALNSSLFYRYYFGRYSSRLSELVSLPDSRARTTLYSNRMNHFLSLILYVIRMPMSMWTVSFLLYLISFYPAFL